MALLEEVERDELAAAVVRASLCFLISPTVVVLILYLAAISLCSTFWSKSSRTSSF